MSRLKRFSAPTFLLVLFFGLSSSMLQAQKVGVVLSGGGTNGLAHVGVLQALEDNHIPIDYIAGTSMGAIVGGLYVSGYSPKEIEALLVSTEFVDDLQGELSEKYIYFFKQPRADASIAEVPFSKDKPFTASLPTNIVSPFGLDFKMLEVFAGANAVSGENFDSLFCPFRCVAADIANKKMRMFSNGQLNLAIRASATYPFYYKPVMTNGELLFDGGIYNNFPVDVLIQDFNPDIIIGSNVSYNYAPPTADDLLSQLKNMLVSPTDYSLRGKPGIIITPQLETSAFDFSDFQVRVDAGRKAAEEQMEQIKALCERRTDSLELSRRRELFNTKKPRLLYESFDISGVNAKQGSYIKRSISGNKDTISNDQMKDRFLKLYQDDQLKYIYPSVKFHPNSNRYGLQLMVEKETDFSVKFGGNFSSKPINTGFLSFRYNLLAKNSYCIEANSYFGKYYGSVLTRARMQTVWSIPIYIEPFAAINRWDYFTNRATFFEDVKPSFIVMYEKFAGIELGMPLRYKSKLYGDVKVFDERCNYYLADEFQVKDTADVTHFSGSTVGATFERNTLNRKQWASKGTSLLASVRYYQGFEKTTPGSTSLATEVNRQYQDWLSFKLDYHNYFKTFRDLTFAFHTGGIYNTQYFFSNYKASLIFSPAFQPIPESKTLFLHNFRANKFAHFGLSGIFSLNKNFDYRIEAYIFQPINELKQTEIQKTKLGDFLGKRYNILSSSLVFHSPFGPVSLSLNYYDQEKQPISFIFNFGFILFNRTIHE